MGSVTFGPPPKFTRNLANIFGIKNFVETGTFRGETTIWAAEDFEEVITIERSESIFNGNKHKFEDHKNIKAFLGDSREIIKETTESPGSLLYWLDAHWCGGETAGEDDECPLIDELLILSKSMDRHFVMIDDARLFLSPPSQPHKVDQWPSLDQIHLAVSRVFPVYMSVFDDITLIVPEWAKEAARIMIRDRNIK